MTREQRIYCNDCDVELTDKYHNNLTIIISLGILGPRSVNIELCENCYQAFKKRYKLPNNIESLTYPMTQAFKELRK